MNKTVKKDILNIFERIVEIIDKSKFHKLKPLSNHTIHCACIFQDEDSISVAVMTFALYKIYTRKILDDFDVILPFVKRAGHYLKKNDIDGYRKQITAIFKTISRYDGNIKTYVEEVIGKAKLNKGCKLVEHGLSVSRASDLMRISQWELMSYLGKTNVSDLDAQVLTTKKRLAIVRELFR